MRYLKLYENYYDSDIASEIKDIFSDIRYIDNIGINVRESENNDSIEINFYSAKKYIYPLNHIESFFHLNSFLESEGYVYFSNGSIYNTYEERRKAFESTIGYKFSLLILNYIKSDI